MLSEYTPTKWDCRKEKPPLLAFILLFEDHPPWTKEIGLEASRSTVPNNNKKSRIFTTINTVTHGLQTQKKFTHVNAQQYHVASVGQEHHYVIQNNSSRTWLSVFTRAIQNISIMEIQHMINMNMELQTILI
jgi:hypothetical protein